MLPDSRREPATTLESTLCDALPALRRIVGDLGATSVAVFLLKEGKSIQLLYGWPEQGQKKTQALDCQDELREVLRKAGSVSAESPATNLLNTVCQLSATSFVLYPWELRRFSVIVAFGFAARHPPDIRLEDELSATVLLAGLAAWSVHEIHRLRAELVVVNERLEKRRLIERAKGLLQVEGGLEEQQAYDYLRRLSRQRRVKIADIAQELLGTSDR